MVGYPSGEIKERHERKRERKREERGKKKRERGVKSGKAGMDEGFGRKPITHRRCQEKNWWHEFIASHYKGEWWHRHLDSGMRRKRCMQPSSIYTWLRYEKKMRDGITKEKFQTVKQF